MKPSESPSTEIARWKDRIVLSKHQRQEDGNIRKKFARWYMDRFYPDGVAGLDEKKIEKRQVPYVGMFARHLQANLYAHAPLFGIKSPWNVPAVNMLLGRVAGRIPDATGFDRVAHKCLLDVAVGRYAVSQVGYEAQIGWDAASADRERSHAQQEGQRMLMGEAVSPSENEDHVIHSEEHSQDLQRAMQQQNPDAIALIQGHLRKTKDYADKQVASPYEYVHSKSVWICRVPPMRDQRISFGWETDAPWDEARWFWSYCVKTVDELKRDPYLKNTSGLEPTHSRKSMLDDKAYEALDDVTKGVIESDRGLVGIYRIISREDEKEFIFAENHDEWLSNERFPHADLFEGTGHHVLALELDPDDGSGKTPTEDAASAIVTVNGGQGKLIRILEQTAPCKIANAKHLDSTEAVKLQRREIGDIVLLDFKGDFDDLRKILVDQPGARLPAENMAALREAQADIGASLGIGDTGLGGTDVSKTATASYASKSSQTGNIEGWGRVVGRWCAANHCDALQIVKTYYDDEETVLRLVGAEDAEMWKQLQPTMRQNWPERVHAKVGSTMPGRADREREDTMSLFQATAGHPLVEQRPMLEDVFVAFGKDPDRGMVSKEEEAQRAAAQPGTQPRLVGGPEVDAGDGGRPSEAQTPDDLQREVRSKASERSAEAQRA